MKIFVAILGIGLATLTAHSQSLLVSNVDFQVEGMDVLIRYDLVSPDNRVTRAKVSVFLTDRQGTNKIIPRSVSGDIGRVRTGRGKTIRWHAYQDFPGGISYPSVSFVVEASPMRSRAAVVRRLLMFAGAAVLVAGGSLAVIALTGGPEYPKPPPRPAISR